jgi:hypothetical protein
MATFTNETKNTGTFTNETRGLGGAGNLLLIESTFKLMIDSIYFLGIDSSSPITVWTNETKP